MHVVLDSNVLISALVGHGEPRRLLHRFLDEHVIVSSVQTLAELEDVLSREKFGFTTRIIQNYISLIASGSFMAEVRDYPKVIEEDPDYDIVIATAVNGDAEYIVTGDSHLLRLGEYRKIKIVTVREIQAILNRMD